MFETNWKPILKPLTAEEIESVINANDEHKATAKQFFDYWRMKKDWIKLDRFEKQLEESIKKQQTRYREGIIEDMKRKLAEYEDENDEKWKYYRRNVSHYADGRTMTIGIPWYDWKGHVKTMLIEEVKNPAFFEECLKKINHF